jgi:hypothetical protein
VVQGRAGRAGTAVSTPRVLREYPCVGTGGDSAGIKDRAAASPRRRWAVLPYTHLFAYIYAYIYKQREMYVWLDVHTLSCPVVGHVRT